MYVTQAQRDLQTPPFGSIIDGEPIFGSLRGAVNSVTLVGQELVMWIAKMTVYGVTCDEGTL